MYSLLIFTAIIWAVNLLTWGFVPLRSFLDNLRYKYNNFRLSLVKIPLWLSAIFYLIDNIFILLGCTKCSGFWVGLLYYGDVYLALLVSLLSYVLEKIIK